VPVVVVGVDGSEGARAALRLAVLEARLRGATLRVVHAWQIPPGFLLEPPIDGRIFEEIAHGVLEEAVAQLGEEAAGIDVEAALVEGQPARALTESAVDADLLVVGSRGRGGFSGRLLGSTSQQCAHHAPCPVLIVPPDLAE
jgi:nucleotide-binding universal stress UspA family protein